MVIRKTVRVTKMQKVDAFGIEAICRRIAECETIESIATSIGVSKWDVLKYVNSEEHLDAHRRAREAQADKHAADILAISDELTTEAKWMDETVVIDVSSAAVARNRLRVDTRKWLAAKMAPRKYSDKYEIASTVTVLSQEDVDKRLSELLKKT